MVKAKKRAGNVKDVNGTGIGGTFDTQHHAKTLFEDDDACPECGLKTLSHDRGEVFCRSCGAVSATNIYSPQEQRTFGSEHPERAGTGAPLTPTKHDQGIATDVGKAGELYRVSPAKRMQYYRLRKWNSRVTESKDRNMSLALSEVQRMVSMLKLPATLHERIAQEYRQAYKTGLVRGCSTETIVGALTYAMCREYKMPRQMSEIAEASNIEKRKLWKTYRCLSRGLGIRVPAIEPKDYVPRFVSVLGLDNKVLLKASEMLDESKRFGFLPGKAPAGVAAAAIYIASILGGDHRTQRDIATAMGVTEVTVRKTFEELAEKLGIEYEIEDKMGEYKTRRGRDARTRRPEKNGYGRGAVRGEHDLKRNDHAMRQFLVRNMHGCAARGYTAAPEKDFRGGALAYKGVLPRRA